MWRILLILGQLLLTAWSSGCPPHRGIPGKRGPDGQPGPDGPPGPDAPIDLTFEVLTSPTNVSLDVNYTSVLYYSDADDRAQFNISQGYTGQLKQVGLDNDDVTPFRLSAHVGNLQFTADQLPLAELLFVNGTWRTDAPWNAQDEQGPPLSGVPCSLCDQGQDLALSADGNTVAWTAFTSNADDTAVLFVFVRDFESGTWTQQFHATCSFAGDLTFARPGVAISASGDTVALGCPAGPSTAQGVNVFVRTGTTWTLQQAIQADPDYYFVAWQGNLALSSSGNTMAIGAAQSGLGNGNGAIFIWTRTAGVWTQQAVLFPSTIIGVNVAYCDKLSLTSDGNLVGGVGSGDNGGVGAIWVFSRTGSSWEELTKVFPSDPGLTFGISGVRFSGTGDTLVAGSYNVNTAAGAAWVFMRSTGNRWLQQGSRYMVGAGALFTYVLGLAISKDAQTLATTDSSNLDQILHVRIWRRDQTDFVPFALVTRTVLDTAGVIAFSADATTMAVAVGQQGTAREVQIYI